MVSSGARSAVHVGAVIAGTYTVERLLGQGGMGAVWLASHARLPGKKVAIKVLHPDVADAESLARFRREAEIASRLGHPNIVEVHDFNELPDGTPYLVLEYLEGESLAQRLARGPMSLEQATLIVRQVGAALAAAHREEIVHRDLKPQNVFLVPVHGDDGTTAVRAKVLDFGISKMRGSTTIKTQDTSILGTPQYMAPEQALGQHAKIDARTDVFALGAMVYEMLGGTPAFSGASVPEVVFKVVYEQAPPLAQRVPGLPLDVVSAIGRALAKSSEERWPDVPSFVEALTGQPLVTGKRAIATAAGDASEGPASDKISSKEAFARTVGSGDHAAAAGTGARSIGSDETIASGNHPPPMRPAGPSETSAPPARGRTGLVIAVVGIVAAAAMAIAFLMTRDRGGPSTATSAGTATGTAASAGPEPAAGAVADPAAAAAPATDAAAAAAPAAAPAADAAAAPATDAAPAAAAAAAADSGPRRSADASTRKPKAEAKPDTAPAPDDTASSEDDKALADCHRMLRDGEPEDALRCANLVLEKKPGAAQVYVIRASAYCDLDDQEKAVSALRKLANRPRLRRTAIAYCAKRGVSLE